MCPFYQAGNLVETVLSIFKPRLPRTLADWSRVRALLQGLNLILYMIYLHLFRCSC